MLSPTGTPDIRQREACTPHSAPCTLLKLLQGATICPVQHNVEVFICQEHVTQLLYVWEPHIIVLHNSAQQGLQGESEQQ